ncbi:glycosyl transferase family, a/b domain-containing protein [Zopfochytrium polystomum]|nr:glycosyl transferase family, a/b domain-containing protein [Zopfochytrium polystomum]
MDALLKRLISDPLDFTAEDAGAAAALIMANKATPAQIGAFLVALKLTNKEHDPQYISAIAAAMRDAAVRVDPALVAAANTFNVSTAAGIVAAGAGCFVAKHGNRAASSMCGSADVLEALSCKITNTTPENIPSMLEHGRFCFLFAQSFHPAMKYVSLPRKEIGVRTVFNILGPLTNPARPSRMVVGVHSAFLGQPMAEALHLTGVRSGWVVNGAMGLDEIAPCGPTHVWSIAEDGTITHSSITPADFGLPEHPLDAVAGGKLAHENAAIMRRLLGGEIDDAAAAAADHPDKAILDFVLMNAAALIFVDRKADSLKAAVEVARESIRSGRARAALAAFVEATTK